MIFHHLCSIVVEHLTWVLFTLEMSLLNSILDYLLQYFIDTQILAISIFSILWRKNT